MATKPTCGPKGRRKQAKPQRKVELEDLNSENRDHSTSSETLPLLPSSMSPDTNHNEIIDNSDDYHQRLNGGHKEAAIPEEVLNGLSMHSPPKLLKTGGTADDSPNDLISVKAAVGEQNEDDEKIQEYLQRSDTAVIYPEPVGHSESNVSPLTNGVGKDGDELNSNSTDFYIKCPQCQKGCQSFQSLKEHMETSHTTTQQTTTPTTTDLSITPENASTTTLSTNSGTISPTPSLVGGTGGPFACTQCTSTFTTKDQLEKHELLHSPNAQVSCKICNKTFANVYRLQRHMISHDESAVLRKFKCTECDKAFKFKHHLKEHIRIHSGEKPFECPNCGKRFSHSGSYSSHMTSKKCLVMNLKLGRTRGNNGTSTNNSLLENQKTNQNRSLKRSNISPLNNNIITTSTTNPNYLPILPKYTEAAAAAFLQSSLAAANQPFYLAPPTSLLNPNHSITPYTMPNLGHIFEQLQQHSPLRPPLLENNDNIDDYKTIQDNNNLESPKNENLSKSNSSSCGDLVMDCGDDQAIQQRDQHEDDRIGVVIKSEKIEDDGNGTTKTTNDLEAVKRILETVNAVVTKQFLQANVNKLPSDTSSDCHSTSTVHSPKSEQFNCINCKKTFETPNQLDEHECCEQNDIKSEGLAAKLEDALTTKSDDFQQQQQQQQQQNGNLSGNEEHDKNDDDDCESITTTDHVSEDGRKVRVRSLISDEQLKILKDNYQINPRPKREELEKIAETIGFPVRVVQVWFQNTRARDRREGRLIQVPYNPNPSTTSTTVPVPPPPPPPIPPMRYPLVPSTKYTQLNYISEQPLDLSTKKLSLSNESSPISSPLSIQNHHDNNNDEVVNLSRKSSRSPTPYIYTSIYQNTNSNPELPRQTPSPIDFNNSSSNSSRLAQILAQPAHKLSLPGMGLVPMEQLIQLSATDLPSLSQLISNRLNCLSPNSMKRKWNESADLLNDTTTTIAATTQLYHDDDGSNSNNGTNKRQKISQFALKSLGSPVLGNQEQDIGGQFGCDQCDKSFSKQSSLARHKYEHSGQRPHKCDECPKAFKHKHHLTEHKRLHSGEKPFQCVKCLKRFSHSGSYSQHMNHRYSYCKPYRE